MQLRYARHAHTHEIHKHAVIQSAEHVWSFEQSLWWVDHPAHTQCPGHTLDGVKQPDECEIVQIRELLINQVCGTTIEAQYASEQGELAEAYAENVCAHDRIYEFEYHAGFEQQAVSKAHSARYPVKLPSEHNAADCHRECAEC